MAASTLLYFLADWPGFVHHMGNRGVGNARKCRYILDRCHDSGPPTGALTAVGIEHHRHHDHRAGDGT